ncbi:two-component sensor histidine kinase [Prescottella equi]|uniref:HAMP domain-containing sensor histidine kinase n=1 Tax=Rhodococcus hoagii TaxID=43767 RepID=UPI0009BEE8DD|nr:HAMP domain-containing sensor histidine kinase [Prescottella equi]AVP69472.1 sensor histidine kinase [Prescottella equi]MBM4727500.1 HAMP domain-containing protein [Prescottella equi]NKR26702.1 HAMP domain-containing protein [Prescottella equi]NKR46925.1 HAMP domain-containing protein [Prescottella equi]NKR60198.1 HAMP domain-containing protein [Prescottella equi]
MSWPRPLDPFRSFKVKTGLLVAASLLLASLTFWLTSQWQFRFALLSALVAALVVTQVLAHGMTSPLREMTAAAKAMATGDYSRRVRSTARDEIGQLATAFNQMAEDLEAEDRYRRELIGNVSHELRTPIAALQAVLENVVDGVAVADRSTMMSALAQTERLGGLVADLLDLSRLEGGAVPLRRATFEIEPFLGEVIAQASGPGRSLRVDVDVAPAGLRAVADTARLHQVITNLVDNAARHGSQDSPVRIRIRVRADPHSGDLILDVHDDGPGIPDADRSRVFERFARGGAQDGGTGLGLAIARWAVELHDGRIEVLDTSGGCCIRVALPQS